MKTKLVLAREMNEKRKQKKRKRRTMRDFTTDVMTNVSLTNTV